MRLASAPSSSCQAKSRKSRTVRRSGAFASPSVNGRVLIRGNHAACLPSHRFLCPPPTAIMIGNSWWSDVVRRGEDPKLSPPRVVVSISGEPAPQEGSVEWTAAHGKPFDPTDPPTGTTYIGRCVGKQLFISDVDEKKKKVEALVKIMAPAADDEPERVIGTFPSRPIKVISKPSKKRQSAKNLERKSLPSMTEWNSRSLAQWRSIASFQQYASITGRPYHCSIGCAHRPSLQSICVCPVLGLRSRDQMVHL